MEIEQHRPAAEILECHSIAGDRGEFEGRRVVAHGQRTLRATSAEG
jgi:hypothetical protein